MDNKKDLTPFQKILSVLTGALLIGFMWRLRGNHGFGAKWGMFCVASVLVMLVYALYGNRRKMSYEMLPLCAVFAALTTGGWGTLNSQMSGYLQSTATFTGEDAVRVVEISNFSGIAIMLLLGFGWLPLFAVAFASMFSDKEYKFKEYVTYVAAYYITVLIANLTISHLLLYFINPQAVSGAAEGLADAGHNLTPMMAYITKLGNAAWAKKIPFCRNYFTSINVISSAVGAVVTSLVVGLKLKDKFTAVVSFIINLICALAITLADLVLILDSDRGVLAGIKCPQYIKFADWPIWEYFTGFLFGLGVMLLLCLIPRKYALRDKEYSYKSMLCNDKFRYIYNLILTVLFTFGIILARAFSFRLTELFTDDGDVIEIIITVILSVIIFFPIRKIIHKNMVVDGLDRPFKVLPRQFYINFLPVFVGIAGFTYFFMGSQDGTAIPSYDYGKLFTESGFWYYWDNGFLTETLLMITTFIILIMLFGYFKKALKKKA